MGVDVAEGKYYSREATGYANVGQVDATHPVLGDVAGADSSGGAGAAQNASGWPT